MADSPAIKAGPFADDTDHATLESEPSALHQNTSNDMSTPMEDDDLLEDLVYGGQGAIESNTIAVYVHQLRRKLGEDVIATVHGYGYRLGEER